jgi:hypothetical protein
MDNLIQCEYCEIYVNFDEYSEHILECFENENKTWWVIDIYKLT